MRLLSTRLFGALLGLCLATVQSCSHRPEELPLPATTPEPARISVAEARTWYQTTFPTSSAPSSNNPTSITEALRTSGPTETPLVWARAVVVGQSTQELVLVPLASDAALFAHSSYVGVRYLIVAKEATNALNGNVVELLVRRATTPVDTVALVSRLYRGYRNGHLAAPARGDGLVLVYSADYRYLTGRRFRNGQLLAQTTWLAFQRRAGSPAYRSAPGGAGGGAVTNLAAPVPCIDWFSGQTGEYITHTGDCSEGGGDVPTVYTGGGGPGGSGSGSSFGGSSGSTSGTGMPTTAPTVTLNISLTPCQTTVYTNLKNLNNGMLAFIVAQFGGTATGYNWKLINGALPIGTYGSTGPYDRTYRVITTTFDASQWRNASDLSVARTMMHESVHAYLLTYFANTPALASASYPALVAAYAAAGLANPNIPHHNVMGQQNWLSDLAWGLKQYGQNQGYNLPDQYYADMAWGGLETSQPFLALSQAERDRISNLLRVEATGKDLQGNYRPQGGKPAGCP